MYCIYVETQYCTAILIYISPKVITVHDNTCNTSYFSFCLLKPVLSERKLPAARINLFSSFHFLVFIERYVLPLLHEENAAFPVHQEDYSHQRPTRWVFGSSKWKSFHETSRGLIAIVFHPLAVMRCGNVYLYEKCHRCFYTLPRLFRRVNCVVTEQRSGCIISCLSAPGFFFLPFSLSRDGGPIILLRCHTPPISSQRTANTHILTHTGRDRQRTPHAPKHRHNEPTEDRHHISTEVVNRPSEAFLKGVSSSAFIEPLSDY